MILLLETATLNCSVALATPEGDCVARRDEAGERHQHAERLHVLIDEVLRETGTCLLYTSPSPRDLSTSRMPSSA